MSNISKKQRATLQLAIVSGIQTVGQFASFIKKLDVIIPKKSVKILFEGSVDSAFFFLKQIINIFDINSYKYYIKDNKWHNGLK